MKFMRRLPWSNLLKYEAKQSGLAQLVRFLLDLTCMLYLWLIIFLLEDDASINSDTLFTTDFVNLKIKLDQSFGCAQRNRECVFIYKK
jgi:hypothetical protein